MPHHQVRVQHSRSTRKRVRAGGGAAARLRAGPQRQQPRKRRHAAAKPDRAPARVIGRQVGQRERRQLRRARARACTGRPRAARAHVRVAARLGRPWSSRPVS